MKIRFLFILVLFNVRSFGQLPLWKNYTHDLAVNSMCESNNCIWICNGTSILKYNKLNGDKEYLNHSILPITNYGIKDLCTDTLGNVWFIAGKSIINIDSSGNYFVYDSASWGSNLPIKNLRVSKSGQICFSHNTSSSNDIFTYDGAIWNRYDTIQNGSKIKHVQDLQFDLLGNIYAATDSNLIRFNGSYWQVISAPANSFILNTNLIRFDFQNNLYLSSSNKLYKFDGFNWDTLSNPSINLSWIYDFKIDQNGIVWVIENTQLKLLKFDGINWSTPVNLQYFYRCLFLYDSITIWIGGDGVGKFDGNNFTRMDFLTSPVQSNSCVTIETCKFSNAKLFGFGSTAPGLNFFDLNSWTKLSQNVYWPPSGQNENLPGTVSKIAAFDTNYFYCLSNLGLVGFLGGSWINLSPPCSSNIDKLLVDHLGNLYITCDKGFSKFDGANWILFDSTNTGISKLRFAWDMAEDVNGNIWIGTNVGLIKYDGNSFQQFDTTNSGIYANYVDFLTVDNLNNLWLISKVDSSKWVPYPNPGTYYPWKYSHLQKFDGISFLEIDSASFTPAQGLSYTNYPLFNLECDKNGNVYYDKPFIGLIDFNNSAGTFQNFTFSNSGLSDDKINCLKTDYDNNLWIGTDAGISVYNLGGVTVDIYETQTNNSEFIPFPNPTSDYISFKLPTINSKKNFILEILTVDGKKIKTLNNLSNNLSLFIGGFSKGIYFFKITDGSKYFKAGKFVVQ